MNANNLEISVDKDGILTIKIDTKKTLGPSSSGKTTIVASTRGNTPVPGTDIVLGLNAYRKNQ